MMRTIYNIKKIPLNTEAEIDYWKYFLNLAFKTTSNDQEGSLCTAKMFSKIKNYAECPETLQGQ